MEYGDVVKVVKGRKFPIGMYAIVDYLSPIYDCYDRVVGWYVVTTRGERIPAGNVIVVGHEKVS